MRRKSLIIIENMIKTILARSTIYKLEPTQFAVQTQSDPITFSETEIETAITRAVEVVGPVVVTVVGTLEPYQVGFGGYTDQQVSGSGVIINALYAYQPGESIPLEVVRNNQSVELTVVLGEGSAVP